MSEGGISLGQGIQTLINLTHLKFNIGSDNYICSEGAYSIGLALSKL